MVLGWWGRRAAYFGVCTVAFTAKMVKQLVSCEMNSGAKLQLSAETDKSLACYFSAHKGKSQKRRVLLVGTRRMVFEQAWNLMDGTPIYEPLAVYLLHVNS